MSEDQTERLIRGLADDLTPVRRTPRLRAVVSAVLAVSAAVVVYSLARRGLRPDWWSLASGNATYAAVLLGLAACALGATCAALAGAIPGREAVVQRAGAFAALGLVAAGVVGSFCLAMEGGLAGSLADDWICLRGALYLSPLPVVAVLFAASRGWVGRPGLTASAALAGAACAGALGVHLTCPIEQTRHVLLGHVSAPLVLLLVASYPAALLLRRFAR